MMSGSSPDRREGKSIMESWEAVRWGTLRNYVKKIGRGKIRKGLLRLC